MVSGNGTSITVSRRVDAPAGDIFRILVDPARHVDLDGSGMLREAVSDGAVAAVGDVFVIRMYYAPIGDYEMNNHVVEYEPNRRLVWEPEAGRLHPHEGAPDARWGQRWGFDLAPAGPEATLVTQIYDCSAVPEDARTSMEDGRIWIEAMARTLERLDELATGDPAAS